MNRLLLALIFACCITLATNMAPVFETIAAKSAPAGSPLLALMGDTRRLFANQFFTMADEYFHSGYYPTIFDARKKGGPSHLDVASHEDENSPKPAGAKPDDDEKFLGPPRDRLEAFGRNFFPTVHSHLDSAEAREILPWLKLSAEMDPKRVETYVTAAYWLRTRLNQPREAEEFLRDGLRENPDSSEILLELGRVYFYNKKDTRVARNIWVLALKKWNQQDAARQNPDPDVREQIYGELVRADKEAGDMKQQLADLEELARISPNKGSVEQSIEELKARMTR